MNDKLNIPKELKVGFRDRGDTYTAKLGYVIYYDNKNKLRKETSFNGWVDKKIPFLDKEPNKPTEGFVLNKNVGGGRSYSWHDHARLEKIRIWDPRDFEFEITTPNLLYILQHCNCYKGKGLEGSFVYAWQGKDLILLPTSCPEYQSSIEFTKLQTTTVKVKELKEGATYTTKQTQDLVYVGRKDYWFALDKTQDNWRRSKTLRTKSLTAGFKKIFVFWNEKKKNKKGEVKGGLVFLDSLKTISCLKQDVMHPDFAFFNEKYEKTVNVCKVVGVELKPTTQKHFQGELVTERTMAQMNKEYQSYEWFANKEGSENTFLMFEEQLDYRYNYGRTGDTNKMVYKYKLNKPDKLVVFDKASGSILRVQDPDHDSSPYTTTYLENGWRNTPWRQTLSDEKLAKVRNKINTDFPQKMDLWVVLENGKKYRLKDYEKKCDEPYNDHYWGDEEFDS